MAAKKFKLFIGYLGNGATVCNSAVMEHGDYKTIAHISNAGNIKFYVDEDYIPDSEMAKIQKTAEEHRQKMLEILDRELSANSDYWYGKRIEEIFNYSPWKEADNFFKELKALPEKKDKIELIKKYYLKMF